MIRLCAIEINFLHSTRFGFRRLMTRSSVKAGGLNDLLHFDETLFVFSFYLFANSYAERTRVGEIFLSFLLDCFENHSIEF